MPLLVIAVGSFAGGVIAGASHEPSERRLANRYAAAWEREDYAEMYGMLTDRSRAEIPLEDFARAHSDARTTATLERLTAGRPRDPVDEVVAVPMTARTRIFGEFEGDVSLPLGEGLGGEPAIEWSPHLVFPGLRRGEELGRETRLADRATILSRDGKRMAYGEARESELDAEASEITGVIGPAPPERADDLAARGIPEDAQVGLSGLEREFDAELAGTPGGELLAGKRVLASRAPKRGERVRTTIDPDIQRATVQALAGRYGGIAAVRPRTGEVLGLAGLAFSAPQPPGSVFKIVTLTGALAAHTVRRHENFPVQTAATLEGVELANANGESCGGSLINSFAHSCNSVFAPMGAELGAKKLVAMAEKFGFNEDPVLKGAAPSTMPPAAEIGDDLAVGSTAIGQGKVLTTPLQMALIAAAIGEDGRRMRPTLRRGERTEATEVTRPGIARFVGRAMRQVVLNGTGVGAQVEGVAVAGKTGTAELRSTVSEEPEPLDPSQPPPAEDLTDTDAWFAAYAPAGNPTIAVSVLLIAQGQGGEVAAPAAAQVIDAAT